MDAQVDKDMLILQLSEVEMLASMYPAEGEFELDDPLLVAEMKDYIDDKRVETPSRLSFGLRVNCTVTQPAVQFELLCSLPHQYPKVEPEVFVRCQLLSRQQQKQINEDLSICISEQERGDMCIGEAVQWLQDNSYKYIDGNEQNMPKSVACPEVKDATFTRLWIQSHHIRSKFKRRDILDMTAEMSLTGFCLPGKPGIICVEGYKEICEELWHKIRRWTWKKISCKHREDFPLIVDGKSKTLEDFRFFKGFEEISFDAHAFHGRDYHMDLGKFYQYLEEHNCAYIFKILLGVDGKAPSS